MSFHPAVEVRHTVSGQPAACRAFPPRPCRQEPSSKLGASHPVRENFISQLLSKHVLCARCQECQPESKLSPVLGKLRAQGRSRATRGGPWGSGGANPRGTAEFSGGVLTRHPSLPAGLGKVGRGEFVRKTFFKTKLSWLPCFLPSFLPLLLSDLFLLPTQIYKEERERKVC